MNSSYINATHNLYVSYSVPCIGNRPHEYALCSNYGSATEADDKADEADGADVLEEADVVEELMKPNVVDEADEDGLVAEAEAADEPEA